jgi:NAD(P)-dependent dehydrogenase (short-subunit alcohol dehydrogenase family)
MKVYKHKVAVVTGGASGIGRALGQALASFGARVVLADIDEPGLKTTCDAIEADGGRVRGVALDVSDAAQVQRVIEEIYAQEGPIDYLFNNAGIALFGEAYDMTLEQWQRVIDVNLSGVVYGVACVYPRMVARGSGHIINTASLAGLVPSPGFACYALTKHAVVGLSTSLRGEGAALGVRVTAVCPGLVNTPIKQNATLLRLDREKMLEHPMARFMMARPEHCARVVLRGVARNRSIVTVTGHARMMWWLYRLLPGFVASWMGKTVCGVVRKKFAIADEGPPRAPGEG